MQEKRSLERYCLKVPVNVRIADKPDIAGVQTYTRDVSSSGAYLKIHEQLDVGQRVDLEIFLSIDRVQDFFEMDHQVRVVVSGEVIRNEADGVGIKFDKKYLILPGSTVEGST
jgi:hypothetical protein